MINLQDPNLAGPDPSAGLSPVQLVINDTNNTTFTFEGDNRVEEVPERQTPVATTNVGRILASLHHSNASIQQNQGVKRSYIKNKAVYYFMLQLTLSCTLLMTYVLGYLYTQKDIPINFVFGIFAALGIIHMLITIKTGGYFESYNLTKVVSSVVSTLALLVYAFFAFMKTKGVDHPLYLLGLSVFAITIIAYYVQFYKLGINDESFIRSVLRLALLVTILTIGDGVDEARAPEQVFVILNVIVLCMIIAFPCITIVNGVNSLFKIIIKRDVSQSEIGSLWYFLSSLHAVIHTMNLLCLVDYFYGEPNPVVRNITFGLRIGIAYNSALLLYTLLFQKKLVDFMKIDLRLVLDEDERGYA